MGLFGFEYPLRGEKKLLLEQENLNSVLKLRIFKISIFKIGKWMENELTSH